MTFTGQVRYRISVSVNHLRSNIFLVTLFCPMLNLQKYTPLGKPKPLHESVCLPEVKTPWASVDTFSPNAL